MTGTEGLMNLGSVGRYSYVTLTFGQAWFASPFVKNARTAVRVLRYFYLDLSKHVVMKY